MTTNLTNRILEQAEFKLIVHSESLPVRGNVISSGDAAYDKETEDKILADLENNYWAWCVVELCATWNGIQESVFFGGCSYESDQDFIQSPYYQQMKNEVIEQIATTAKIIAQSVNELKN